MKRLFQRNRPVVGLFWFCVLDGAAFAYAMFQGGFVSWFLFYSLVPILLYVIAVALFPMRSLEVHREINQELFASGAVMRVKVTVTKHSWFPLFFLIVGDVLPEPLEKNARTLADDYCNGSRALFFPGLKRKVEYAYTVEPMPRGEYEWDGVELKTGDVFGFLQKSFTAKVQQQILVYPRYHQVYDWEPFQQHEEGSRRGRRGFQFDITSVSTVRDYSPGDRLSWLDWKSTARTNRLLTKEFDRPLNEDLIVCVDRHSDHYGEHDPLFEKAVTVAASMVRFALKRGSSVGLVSFGREKTLIPLSGDNEQQWKVFYHLAKTKPDGKGNDFPVLSQAFRRFPVKANVIYVTPVVDNPLIQLIEGLVRGRQKVDLFLMAEEGTGPRASTEEVERLRRQGVGIYVMDGQDLNEALKAGMRYATN